MPASEETVCWISSARYSRPLSAVDARKWRLLASLRGYDIRVIGFADSPRPRRFRQSVRFCLLPQPPTSILRYLVMFSLAPPLLAWLALRGKAGIVVAQSPYEGAIAAGVKRVCQCLGIAQRVIIENHNNFEEDLFLQRSIPFESLYRRLMLAAARFAFRHADALRVISSSTAERARHYAPDLPQARFMTFSDTDVFRKAARSVPLSEAVDLVYAGVLIPRKGVHHLLRAFAALDHPRARLHLVGGAENAAYARELMDLARELCLEGRVQFADAVSQADLARYLGTARALVLPSLSEGLGRVVLEAMLLGAPVIGSRVGGIPDLIRDGENGYLVTAGDEADLTRALRRLYASDPSAMGESARAFAESYFSPESYLAGYAELFALARDRKRTRARAPAKGKS